jgi:hypothetical protein
MRDGLVRDQHLDPPPCAQIESFCLSFVSLRTIATLHDLEAAPHPQYSLFFNQRHGWDLSR